MTRIQFRVDRTDPASLEVLLFDWFMSSALFLQTSKEVLFDSVSENTIICKRMTLSNHWQLPELD